MIDRDRALIERVAKPYSALHYMLVNYPEELAALLSAARDEGRAEGLGGEWVMVPREPTEAMLAAGHQQIDWCRNGQRTLTTDDPSQTPGGVGTNCKQDLQDAWKAMLEALPAPPASQTQEG